MPQMAPMLWLPLFITLLTLILIMKSFIYFALKDKSSNKTNYYFNKKMLNWKW